MAHGDFTPYAPRARRADARVKRLAANDGNGDGEADAESRRKLVEKVEQLAQAVVRVTEFGFPLDINLASTDVRALMYETLLRFHEQFAERGISFELDIAPEVNHATVDRLKLREAVGEHVRNALEALPEKGGRVGLRARVEGEEAELLIEVADDGRGADESLVDATFSGEGRTGKLRPGVGLRLVRAIVEQHGGKLSITSEPREGTYGQMRLSVRE